MTFEGLESPCLQRSARLARPSMNRLAYACMLTAVNSMITSCVCRTGQVKQAALLCTCLGPPG